MDCRGRCYYADLTITLGSQALFRFPTFVGEAADKKMPKDADLPSTRVSDAQSTED